MLHRERFELALELLKPSDWETFERFASEFLAPEWPNLVTVASPSGDAGRDAFLHAPTADPTVLLQYSVTEDWDGKIKSTAQTITEKHEAAKILVYVSNQAIGAKADDLRRLVRDKYGLYLDIRDRLWFAERVNSDPYRLELGEKLVAKIADPYLSSRALVTTKAQALSSIEARAALVYLGLQWADDSREKGLTKLCFEALVRAALRETDSEHRLTRAEVRRRVREFLPTHPTDKVDVQTDSALQRITKVTIRHWTAVDEFCLTHDERLRLNDRLAEIEKRDLDLTDEIVATVKRQLAAAKLPDGQAQDIAARVRRVLEKFLLGRGEIFAAAVKNGEYHDIGFESLQSIVVSDFSDHPLTGKSGAYIDVISEAVKEIVSAPHANIVPYLRSLADSYTLMAFLRETPDVQSAVMKMFYDGEIWLDTSVILPLLVEQLPEIEQKKFTAIIRAATEAGLKLKVTRGVIEEVERHINRCLAYCQNRSEWRGTTPFVVSVYASTGRGLAGFKAWTDRFRGDLRPEEDIAQFLSEELDIWLDEFGLYLNNVDPELRIAVKEAWIEIHESRRRRHEYGDMDNHATMRLAEHDTENFVGVIGKRTSQHSTPYGYTCWWLTLDGSARDVVAKIRPRILGRVPHTPIMSADFLVNYLAFGPVRRQIGKGTEAALPLILEGRLTDAMPQELIEIAERVRAESKDLPEYAIRRKVRDELDKARTRLGPVASGGIPRMEAELSAQRKGSA